MKTTFQGFQHFCKVVDIFLKALEVTYFLLWQGVSQVLKAQATQGGVKGMPFKTFLRQKTQKCCFNLFRTQESASQAGLKFTQILFLSRNDNKQSPQFCLNEKRNQSNILPDQQRKKSSVADLEKLIVYSVILWAQLFKG